VQQAAQARVLYPCQARPVWLPYDHTPIEALLVAPLIDLPYFVSFALWTLAAVLAVFPATRQRPSSPPSCYWRRRCSSGGPACPRPARASLVLQ
jgi:hypothetical protein